MYFWKVNSLVEDFKSGRVPQKEEFKYYLFSVVIILLFSNQFFQNNFSYNFYDTFEAVSALVITILGVSYCYRVNSSGDNRDFIARVVCLGVPVSIRLVVMFIPVMLVAAGIDVALMSPEEFSQGFYETTPMDVVVMSVLMAVYYWYLSSKLKAVSCPPLSY